MVSSKEESEMKIRLNNREPNRWTFIYLNERSFYYDQQGWRKLSIGLVKFRENAKQEAGAMAEHGKHYKGFWFQIEYWLPFIIKQWR